MTHTTLATTTISPSLGGSQRWTSIGKTPRRARLAQMKPRLHLVALITLKNSFRVQIQHSFLYISGTQKRY